MKINMSEKNYYTKQELLDMGFAFDLNGNIRTPNECYESAIKYTEYRKQKLIDNACMRLKEIIDVEHDYANSADKLINDFRKAMEGLK